MKISLFTMSFRHHQPQLNCKGAVISVSRVVLNVSRVYGLLPELMTIAGEQSKKSGGRFEVTCSMEEAFRGAYIVYPRSWAPYQIIEKRTELLSAGDMKWLETLEVECLENNKRYIRWECTEKLMGRTDDALYMHCLPADISGVSCKRGEVKASVFDRFRTATYTQAGYKPYIIITATIFLGKVADPVSKFKDLERSSGRRMM
jgi:ornithine carbamoyltransferase